MMFERFAIDVLRETNVSGAMRILRISWDEAWHLMERAVARGQRAKKASVVTHIGVDEKAVAKGQTYMTLVCDIDRGIVEYIADDRKQEVSVRRFASGAAVGSRLTDAAGRG
jgi:hypothetical protein